MTTEWTEERLAALEEAAKKATRGPWVARHDELRDRHELITADRQTTVAWVPRESEQDERNLEFLAAAREALPGLVAEVRRLKEENAKLREEVHSFEIAASVEYG